MPSLPIGVALGFKVVTHITTCRYCMFGILLSEICSIFFYIYIYYIYICSRFSWNISHTSHLLKDYAYVVVDANACRQKQVYLLNSNVYSQLFSDHPSLYIYIMYIYVYLKSIGATFFSRGLGDLLSGLGCAKTGCQGGRLWGKSWGFCHWIGLVGTIWYNLIPIQWGGEAPKLTVGS